MMSPIWWLLAALTLTCKAHKAGIARNQNDTNTSGSVSGVYQLSDLYNSTNFFDKFHFNESITGTAEYTDVDKTSGFVLYQSQSEAERLGLIQTVGDVSQIKVEANTAISDPTGYGRKSVKIQSHATYNHGLFITDFSHLPPPLCGVWPAFWMSGADWPTAGEIDIYEQWNTYKFNRQTLHTTYNTTVGNCTFNTTSTLGLNNYDMTNYIYSDVCDVYASDNVGCSSWDYEGPYGSAEGGVYALEWTSEYIKMWAWHPEQVPSDVIQRAPDPSTWGMPGLIAGGSLCDIDRAFQNQSIVFNIDLCGVTAGEGSEWASECAEKTGYNTCQRYVAANPGAFEEAWFGVRSIAVYNLQQE
ncbi:hypothetical protein VM1G_02968 [Cytospora mali]|uniref:GH16 domain-containing protein n=1 Tax=Cytospora mali TaxID=578113 RepID=A0A194VT55_CYTMA|nr:hypothetical protein VM1G_02968 [Valsa mali]